MASQIWGIAGGAVSGLVVSALAARLWAQPHATVINHPPSETRGEEPRIVYAPMPEEQFGRVRAASPSAEAPAASGASNASSLQLPDPEEVKAQNEAKHAAAIEQARKQPVDAPWARRTEGLFVQDLHRLESSPKAHGAQIASVTCRDTSCLADLKWPSYANAKDGWRAVIEGAYQANCNKEILLGEPSDPDAPYQATAVFDCGEWKADPNLGQQ